MLIDLDHVAKDFGAHRVLNDISFGVPQGSFTVLVGPSGCGKSTLLRLLAGLEDASAGEIRIGGRMVNDVAPKDRDIAMVFQNYALYPHMSVAQNMGFSLAMRGEPKAKIDAAVAEAARVLELESLLDRRPAALSGGQRQRVAMGRAIVRRPAAFLFDEPLSNLDAQLRGQMRTEIRALHRRLGATCVYVTHDQVEAMTMADQIVVLRAGRIEQVGAPLDLYDRPANRFVAGFIGAPGMNLLDAHLAEDRSAVVLAGGQRLALAGLPDLRGGAPVVLGLRPEHVVPAAEGEGIEVAVESVETTGAEQAVVGRAGGQRLAFALRDRRHLAPDDRLRLSAPPGAIHLFDAESGLRLAG